MPENARYSLCSSLVIAVLLTPAFAIAAGSQTLVVPFSGAGSSTASSIDTNGDGIPGFTAVNYGSTFLGSFTANNYNESSAPSGVNTTHCPGAAEYPLISIDTVFTFSDHSQFFEKLVSGYFCIKPDFTFSLVASTLITSGNGRFQGVTGTIETRAQGSVVAAAGSGANVRPILLQQTFQGTITLNVPDGVHLHPEPDSNGRQFTDR